jgi:hypothetical protein
MLFVPSFIEIHQFVDSEVLTAVVMKTALLQVISCFRMEEQIQDVGTQSLFP